MGQYYFDVDDICDVLSAYNYTLYGCYDELSSIIKKSKYNSDFDLQLTLPFKDKNNETVYKRIIVNNDYLYVYGIEGCCHRAEHIIDSVWQDMIIDRHPESIYDYISRYGRKCDPQDIERYEYLVEKQTKLETSTRQ